MLNYSGNRPGRQVIGIKVVPNRYYPETNVLVVSKPQCKDSGLVVDLPKKAYFDTVVAVRTTIIIVYGNI